MEEYVILVDADDAPQGKMEKLEAHQKGLLHRAFSVFIFNDKQELLLQQRAQSKYHSAGLWTNTCCSHPRWGESDLDAARRRLFEEMGMNCSLQHQFRFQYEAAVENGLIEHELDHVFFGITNDLPVINKLEVADYKYIQLDALRSEIESHPDHYTSWLKICLDQVISFLKNKNGHTA